MDLTKTVLFTVFMLIWEASRRVRGAWRRREWRKLGRYAVRAVFVALPLFVVGVLVVGCTVVPAVTAHRACRMLDIAHQEADLAPAWYINAGLVLEACGDPEARVKAAAAACAAEKRNGYECLEEQ